MRPRNSEGSLRTAAPIGARIRQAGALAHFCSWCASRGFDSTSPSAVLGRRGGRHFHFPALGPHGYDAAGTRPMGDRPPWGSRRGILGRM